MRSSPSGPGSAIIAVRPRRLQRRAASSREDAYLPGSGFVEYDLDAGPVLRSPPLVGPQWLVSVSRAGRGRDRPIDAEVARVVDAFAMPAFDEDNHHPGVARHLWCPIEEQYRNACECKLTEIIVTDADGYRWTTDSDGPCRGCEYERILGYPCPLHAAETSGAGPLSPGHPGMDR